MDSLSTSHLTARPITLALEGGGALGAFTWGVLDRLLDATELRIEMVSGTSAGAMNAAMLVQGLVSGDPAKAKEHLETFWHRVAIAAGSLPGPPGRWLHMMAGTGNPLVDAVRQAGSALTPSVVRFAINPLRGILGDILHPPLFGEADAPTLVVAATRVRTGEARLFWGAEVSIDALLASSCLPQLFPAVEIDGEGYWDGGYSSNPPVRPLIEAGAPPDVLIVRTGPAQRLGLPTGQAAVRDRVSEITFGTPLRAELRSLALAQSTLPGVSGLPPRLARLRDARVHMIAPLDGGDPADALHPSWSSFSAHRAQGHAAAEAWLREHLPSLGHRSTVDLAPFAPVPAEAASA